MRNASPESDGLDLTAVCPLTAADALRRAVTIAPDLEAVVGPHRRVTFEQLDGEVQRIRRALRKAGIRRRDHVGICAGNGVDWVALFLAIGAEGAVTVPINTRLKADEIAYALRQARVQLLFVADRFLKIDFIHLLREICPGVDTALPDPALPDLSQVVVLGSTEAPRAAQAWHEFITAGDGHDAPPAQCSPDDELLIQYTSGTTAAPKGVVLTHRNLLANGFFAGQRVGLRAGDRFHSARPFFHVAGTSQSILACLQHAATLVTMDRFEAGDALRLMEEERCTHFSANDTMALMLLDHPDRPRRRLVLRGAWLAASSTIAARVVEELGAREVVLAYGQSEASPNVSLSCWWEPQDLRISGRMRLQPGVEVRIRDANGALCPPGVIGEIQVRGWNVMRGYFEKPAETAAVLSADGWLATGDLGRLGEDGRLEFVGRLKEMIRVGGENVAPADIEDVLQRHPKVRQAQVVGVPHPRLVEVPAAFVVTRDGSDCSSAELLEWCRARLAGFKVPHYLLILEDFERVGMTASAKVRKSDLRAYALRTFKLSG
jgi:fatty-acyl-CoA synthase